MGIHGARHASSEAEAAASLPSHMRGDFSYFMANMYRGDFDDFAGSMVQDFQRWYNNGGIRRQPAASRASQRLYIDVPFSKKDAFKNLYKGLWDPANKCWYIKIGPGQLRHYKEDLARTGYTAILLMPMDADKVEAVFHVNLAKSKFPKLHTSWIGVENQIGAKYTG